jgi:hypothetical protein
MVLGLVAIHRANEWHELVEPSDQQDLASGGRLKRLSLVMYQWKGPVFWRAAVCGSLGRRRFSTELAVDRDRNGRVRAVDLEGRVHPRVTNAVDAPRGLS